MDFIPKPIPEISLRIPKPGLGRNTILNFADLRGMFFIGTKLNFITEGVKFSESPDFWEDFSSFFKATTEALRENQSASSFQHFTVFSGLENQMDIDGDGSPDGGIDEAMDFQIFTRQMRRVYGDQGIDYADYSSLWDADSLGARSYIQVIKDGSYTTFEVGDGVNFILGIMESMRRISLAYEVFKDIDENPWWMKKVGTYNLAAFSFFTNLLQDVKELKGIFEEGDFCDWVMETIDEYASQFNGDNPAPIDVNALKAEYKNFSKIIDAWDLSENRLAKFHSDIMKPMMKGILGVQIENDMKRNRNEIQMRMYKEKVRKKEQKKIDKKRSEAIAGQKAKARKAAGQKDAAKSAALRKAALNKTSKKGR